MQTYLHHLPSKQRIRAILSSVVLSLIMGVLFLWFIMHPSLSQAAPLDGSIIYVDLDASGPTHDGASWTTAYTSLHAALAAASTGNELWVAEGVYYATSSFNLKNSVEIYGGFAATETLRTERDWQTRPTVLSGDLGHDDVYTGTLYTASWADQRGANANHVVVANNVDATARLDGFIVTAGAATSDFGGGGILNQSSSPGYYNLEVRGNRGPTYGGGMLNISSSPHLENVLFDSNRIDDSTFNYGGGMYDLYGGSPTLMHVTFNNNIAGLGGGYGSQGSPYLEDVTFSNNRVASNWYGGGAYFHDGVNATLLRVTFINNRASIGGGLYAFNGGSLTMTDTTFIQNTTFDTGASSGDHGGGLAAYGNIEINAFNISFIGNDGECGGGVYLSNASTLNLRNGLFRGNSAGGGGGLCTMYDSIATLTNVTLHGNRGSAIRTVYGSSAITATNSILWGNWPDEINNFGDYSTINITYSDVQQASGVYSGTGNINSDPLFVTPIDATQTPTTTGDVHISPASPVIDAGSNTNVTAATDFDGNPRRVDVPAMPDTGNGTAPIVDMGAYESLGFAPDLQAHKTNDVNGAAALDVPFNWTVVLSNTGNAAAEFADTARLLNDDLPATDATYGAPLVSATGLTGTVACTVEPGPSLQCAASGAATLAVGGRLTITLPVTSTAFGTLVNPRAGGACQPDPDDSVAEIFEDNNTCNVDTVTVGQATFNITFHDDTTDHIMTSAPISAAIYERTTLTDPVGLTPTGVVTLTLHDDAACAHTALATDVQTLVNGVADSATMEAHSLYYQVRYSGDSTHVSSSSACTLFSAYQPGPTFTVNTTADDTLDGVCSDIHCTLREAITAANDTTGDNTILFEVGDNQTLTLASALPGISGLNGALTIDGGTHALTISGADLHRVFKANSNARATLLHLTIMHGKDTSSECGGASCGGGLKIESGAAITITHSAILSSTAAVGGGILNQGTLRMDHSVLAGNTATQYGGGIMSYNGSLLIENSTLSGNTANSTDTDGGGGALDQWGSSATATFTNSTVVNNTAVSPNQARSGIWLEGGTLTLYNTIVANNNGANNFQQSGGTFTSLGYNLSNAWNGLSLQPTDLTGDPLLGPLALNGNGWGTLSHTPLPGSPAINAGDPSGCPAADQRDIPRPQPSGGECDIGAIEWANPEMAVLGNGIEVNNGDSTPSTIDHTDFGSVNVGEVLIRTFTISNNSMYDLLLTGSPLVKISGTAATDFSVVALPVAQVGPYLTTTFAVRFAPTARTAQSATVTIANSDSDENPYTFAIQGTAVCDPAVTVQNANDSGAGSLRQAIVGVCDGGTIDFVEDTAVYLGSQLVINKPLTIDGSGYQVIVSGDTNHDGSPNTRVFLIDSAAGVTLTHLNIVSGTVTGNHGGGIYNLGGQLTVISSTLADNSAPSGNGGGIYNNAGGQLTVLNSTLSANAVGGAGGGIYNDGQLTVRNSTFANNLAPNSSGGGIYNGGHLTSLNSTLAGNKGSEWPGGGGVFNAGTMAFTNTLMADSPSPIDCYSSGTISANSHNLIESYVDGGCDTGGTGNILGTDPVLGPLADHGGGTLTFALLPNSPAIDAGEAACPTTDQRGLARDDLGCDMGTFELRYADSDTVWRSVGGTAVTTFGPTLAGIRNDGGVDDPGVVTAVKSFTWATKPDNTIDAYWHITPGSGTSYNLTLQLCYLPAELNGLSEADLRFWRYSGGGWTQVGPASLTWETINGNRCASVSGVTGFSDWTLGVAGTPTAVSLATFSASTRIWWMGLLVGVLMVGGGTAVTLALRRKTDTN